MTEVIDFPTPDPADDDEPGIPAPDPGNAPVRLDVLFNVLFTNVLGTIMPAATSGKADQQQYRLKAADIARDIMAIGAR